jgi:choline dehydrogenase-like flavoprotein
MSSFVAPNFDVVIVGSGPAGVSAAFPLVKAGLRVLMVDGGRGVEQAAPSGQFLDIRQADRSQWRWMVGDNFHALKCDGKATSPKLRVPIHAPIFDGYLTANRIEANSFVAIGSLASGGLSNAWGCGVACLTEEELAAFPLITEEMKLSYGSVARRIGVSGGRDDDLTDFFGLDEWSQPPVPTDELQTGILKQYLACREGMLKSGFRLGRSRVAVITEPLADRKACDLSGNCLWGCDRRALYSATEDLQSLLGYKEFYYRPGFKVGRIFNQEDVVVAEGIDKDGAGQIRARRLLLAAGTLASTRLALQAINYREPIAIESSPTAAFMLWLPRHLGLTRAAAFGLGQLSFTLNMSDGSSGFGSLFNPTGIPVSEFARVLPFGKRYAVDLLESLLSSCVVGNFFLPGAMAESSLYLNQHDALVVTGGYRNNVPLLMQEAHRQLSNRFRRLGALIMPKSFTVGHPGSDVHYAGSMPMREIPKKGQTDRYGLLVGMNGIHVVDGASLSFLPSKPHTLTIMANADRIARHLAETLIKEGA